MHACQTGFALAELAMAELVVSRRCRICIVTDYNHHNQTPPYLQTWEKSQSRKCFIGKYLARAAIGAIFSMNGACVSEVAAAFVTLVLVAVTGTTDPHTASKFSTSLELNERFEHVEADCICNRTILRPAPVDHLRL